MLEIEYKKVRIEDICTPAKSDKTLTRAKAKDMEGNYPVYAATIGEAFAYINTYNNTKPCLVVVNDGDAGNTYIVNDLKYTIGKHATGLIPNDNIDMIYLQKVVTPIFMKIAKGYGLGNLPKADVLHAEISIPVKNGQYDIQLQKKLASIYIQISEKKEKLVSKISELQNINVLLPKDDNISWKEVKPTDLFYPKGGNMRYSKAWCKDNTGDYPLYSGITVGKYDHINIADYEGEYLSWCIDGLAGHIMYHNEKFSVTCHRGVLEPIVDMKNIDLRYIKYVLEPIFRKRKKGREGDLGKNEYTSLKPIAIKNMKDTIPMPIKSDGTFDLNIQRELADRYEQIDSVKEKMQRMIQTIVDVIIE